MEGSSLKDRVMVELTKAEALVLSDWLSRFNKEVDEQALHPAEKRVLWDLECSFEQALVEPFGADYLEALNRAKADVGQ
jgi:hypothetical protein